MIGKTTICPAWRYKMMQFLSQTARWPVDALLSPSPERSPLLPVLNVPFRLIYAFNPNRDQFQKKSTFKFAVGTTF